MNAIPRIAFSLSLLVASIEGHAELNSIKNYDKYQINSQLLTDKFKYNYDRDVPKYEKVTADLIAASGHGLYLDKHGNKIEMTDQLRADMQDAIIQLLLPHAEKYLNKNLYGSIKDSIAVLSNKEKLALSMDERLILQSAVMFNLVDNVPEALKKDYTWRQRLLFRHIHRIYRIRPELSRHLSELLKRLGFFDYHHRWTKLDPISFSYEARCRAAGVPVPSEWSENPASGWKYQGELTTNLLDAGADAHVWTWTDDSNGGGCIALPRDSGGPGSLAGIICQSESTGKACFWDNALKSDSGQSPIGWSGRVLRLNQLHNGDTLNENCTGCHRGNNVFLISPDDPTWQRTINPNDPDYDSGLLFTTNLPAGMRYEPVSSQSDWENPVPTSSSCAGACHEPDNITGTPPMPPACATSDVEDCYR